MSFLDPQPQIGKVLSRRFLANLTPQRLGQGTSRCLYYLTIPDLPTDWVKEVNCYLRHAFMSSGRRVWET